MLPQAGAWGLGAEFFALSRVAPATRKIPAQNKTLPFFWSRLTVRRWMARLPAIVAALRVRCVRSYSKRLFLLALLVLGWLGAGQGEEGPCLHYTAGVNVVDKHGNTIEGLAAQDFQVKVGRLPLEVRSAALHRDSCRIVILLDVSGSMTAPSKWDLALTAAEDIVLHAPSGCRLALIVFAEGSLEKVGLGQGRRALNQLLQKVRNEQGERLEGIYGRTALHDGILQGLRLLDPPQLGDALYIITDGSDNVSEANRGKVEEVLHCSGVRTFVFLLEHPFWQRSWAEDLGKKTGGFAAILRPTFPSHPARYVLDEEDRAEIAGTLRLLYERMAQFYRLEMRSSMPLREPREWQVDVVDADGQERATMTVIHSRKLCPCTKEAD